MPCSTTHNVLRCFALCRFTTTERVPPGRCVAVRVAIILPVICCMPRSLSAVILTTFAVATRRYPHATTYRIHTPPGGTQHTPAVAFDCTHYGTYLSPSRLVIRYIARCNLFWLFVVHTLIVWLDTAPYPTRRPLVVVTLRFHTYHTPPFFADYWFELVLRYY